MTEDFHTRDTQPGVAVPEVPHAEHETPDLIGPYRIDGVLQHTQMSDLYLATDPKTHEPRVIKVLAARFVTHPEMKERFHKEAEIISLADHSNIVKLYDHGEWEEGAYIAMEFIQGISLRQFIMQHTMSMKRSLEVVLEIASALDHLHSHGVIHRDLKPENILLTADGGVKVIDFGIAQLGPEHAEEKAPRIMGTPIYMSPEQKKNPLQVAFNTDIYSLGIIAYELILGRITHGAVHIGLMPRPLQDVLKKALDPDPEKRYQHISELYRDIEAFLHSEAVQKEQETRGYLQDLATHLRTAQTTILPQTIPSWPHVEIGLASHQDLSVSGLYYDFVPLNGTAYGIILSEPSSTGALGVIHSAMLQGMFHALTPDTDMEAVVAKINKMIVEHGVEQAFTLNYLVLDPQNNDLHYISCGFGPLWLIRAGTTHTEVIPSENIALGIDPSLEPLSVTHNWHVGDALILSTFHAGGAEDAAFQDAVEQVLYTTPQNQAEGVLRRMVHSDTAPSGRRPMTVISLHRKR